MRAVQHRRSDLLGSMTIRFGCCVSGIPMRVSLLAICGLLLAPVLVDATASAQGTPAIAKPRPAIQAPDPKSSRGATARTRGDEGLKLRLNNWTIGLAAGLLEGS